MSQPNQEHQRFEHIGIAQSGVSQVFLFGLAILLQHLFHLRRGGMLGGAGQRLFVVQPGIHQPFVARAHGRKCSDQIAIIQGAVRVRRLCQSVAEPMSRCSCS